MAESADLVGRSPKKQAGAARTVPPARRHEQIERRRAGQSGPDYGAMLNRRPAIAAQRKAAAPLARRAQPAGMVVQRAALSTYSGPRYFIQFGADFETNHLASTRNQAETKSLARANASSGAILLNTVMKRGQVVDVVKASELDNWTDHGSNYKTQALTINHWPVECIGGTHGIAVRGHPNYVSGNVTLGAYFNANRRVRVTHVG